MSGGGGSTARKEAYFSKLKALLEEYPQMLFVGADNVGSKHMQSIRNALRGKAVLLMGKNTMVRKAIRQHMEKDPKVEVLLPVCRGNVGIVFVKSDLAGVMQAIEANVVKAPAKAGAIAPCSVVVPAGNTGLEPTKTSFLQALNIPSKITRGQIEIINDVPLIEEGGKVGSSEATLCKMLNITPFLYGLKVQTVYDAGQVYPAAFLKITPDDVVAKFREAVRAIAALSVAMDYPTMASIPNALVEAYKNVVCVALETKHSFKQVESMLEYLENPEAFASAAAAATPAAAVVTAAAAAPEPEKESSSDGGMGGLFD